MYKKSLYKKFLFDDSLLLFVLKAFLERDTKETSPLTFKSVMADVPVADSTRVDPWTTSKAKKRKD